MEVTETLNEGLKRAFKVVVDAAELERDFSTRLGELSGSVRLKGFRPGKVPVNHLRKVYGKSVMAEVVQKKVDDSTKKALAERQLKPAYTPEISLPQDEAEIENVMSGKGDLAFTVSFEVIPPIEVKEFSGLAVEKLVVDVTDQHVAEALERIAKQNREFEKLSDEQKTEKGDRLVLSFVGKIEGEAFEGGSAENVPLELGSGQFLPGFEDQLIGSKAGDSVVVNVTFPEEYSVKTLAGKPAQFDVKVVSTERPKEVALDDEFAKKLGLEGLDALKENVRQRIGAEFAQMTAMKLKRDVLDKLDESYSFELPQRLVDAEFDQIWRALLNEMKRTNKTFADEGTTEEDARNEYRSIASRRVRLGLLLGTVGEQAGVIVTDDEMQHALIDRARQFPGQEKKVVEYYRKNTGALIELRGPLFEQKVVDYIVGKATVSEKKVAREELAQAIEEERDHVYEPVPEHDHHHDHDHDHHGHDHGHDHLGHDHDHDHELHSHEDPSQAHEHEHDQEHIQGEAQGRDSESSARTEKKTGGKPRASKAKP